MVTRAGLYNQDMEFVQFHPTGNETLLDLIVIVIPIIHHRSIWCWMFD